MYTLHVVASERRLSQVTLTGAGRSGSLGGAAASRPNLLGDGDSVSDDSEGELLGLDLDNDSQAIEFTAGNPRVEHITGVVHLYRPTPGRLPQTTHPLGAAASAASLAAAAPSGGSLATAALSVVKDVPPPAKGAASWASLFSPPAATQLPVQAPSGPAAPGAERCDELCCLALPSDMTIADFCTFLGAHLLRLRRMRVLRRQVGPTGHVAATHASTAATAATAAAAAAAAAAATVAALARPASGAGAGHLQREGKGQGRRQMATERDEQAERAVPQDEVSELERRQQSGHGTGTGPGAEGAARSVRVSSSSGGDTATRGSGTGVGQQQLAGQGTIHEATTATITATGRPSGSAPRPSCQRVVCMVVMRMESPEAADELYGDLNGKPFSSLEPDVVCRLVHVRHVEVTSGHGKHAAAAIDDFAAAAAAAAAAGPGPPAAATAAAVVDPALHTSPQQQQLLPPPGQTELPTCPVCLERLDEHVSGIVTTVCNHMFHSECLQKWADTTCPVCRYCVQGAANASRCGLCSTAVDLWICLICGHVGCGRYRAGHAADHWRTSGHCYALELETQRVWDYVGDNYVHRLIQSKTDGKLVELAAPATAVASPHDAARGGAATGHRHHQQHADGVFCGAAAGGVCGGRDGGGGGRGGGGGHRAGPGGGGGAGADGGAGGSGAHDGDGGPGWNTADEQLKEALMASKLDAIAVEYNHLLASQLDSQRQYYEGLMAQTTLDADHRCAQAGATADKARIEADEAQSAAREEARRCHTAERKAAETMEALRAVRQEAEFLRSLNETLLANQRDFKQQLVAEKARREAAEAAAKELQEQVRDLAFFIEAQRTINDASGGELKEGTVLPLPQGASARGGRGGGSSSGSRSGARPGGGGSSRSTGAK